MRFLLAAILLLFTCFEAGADTLSAGPMCTCTVVFPGPKSAEAARLLKRASCRCAVSNPRGAGDSPIKGDARDLQPDHSGSAVAVAILALALVTGSQALYTAKLWKSTRRLADSGQATAQRQLRAYVAVSDIVYEPAMEHQAPQVTVIIRNFGATPAYKLAIAVDAQIASGEQQLSVAVSASKTLGQLPQGVESTITRRALGHPAMATGESDGARSVFVHGCIEYVDTFGEPHFTRFRLQGGPDQKFSACREGNETDDVLLLRSRA